MVEEPGTRARAAADYTSLGITICRLRILGEVDTLLDHERSKRSAGSQLQILHIGSWDLFQECSEIVSTSFIKDL